MNFRVSKKSMNAANRDAMKNKTLFYSGDETFNDDVSEKSDLNDP